jgi:IS30 family transposase
MRPNYKHLTIQDRRQIYRLRGQNVSVTEIATRLGSGRINLWIHSRAEI